MRDVYKPMDVGMAPPLLASATTKSKKKTICKFYDFHEVLMHESETIIILTSCRYSDVCDIRILRQEPFLKFLWSSYLKDGNRNNNS